MFGDQWELQEVAWNIWRLHRLTFDGAAMITLELDDEDDAAILHAMLTRHGAVASTEQVEEGD